MCSIARKIIDKLNGKERQVIEILFESYKSGVSERTMCRNKGIDQGTFIYRKKNLFEKIRRLLK